MSKRKWISLAVGAVAVLAAYFINVEVQSHLGRKAREARGITTHSLAEALALARAEGKPVLAELSAVWCPSCRRLDQRVLADPAVRDHIADNYVFAAVELESEEGEAFMERYGVHGIPTLLVLDADGSLVRELTLTFDPKTFLGELGS